MEGRGSQRPDGDGSGGDTDRAFPLTIREILRRQRLAEREAEPSDAETGEAAGAQPITDLDPPAPASEPVPDMRYAPPAAPDANGREAELDRLRVENEQLRLRVEAADRQIEALRASKATRWNRVAVLPTSEESG